MGFVLFCKMVRNLVPLQGATFSKSAFESGWDEVWTPHLNSGDRTRITMWLSDGVATANQNPCSVVSTYIQNSVDVISVQVGKNFTFFYYITASPLN